MRTRSQKRPFYTPLIKQIKLNRNIGAAVNIQEITEHVAISTDMVETAKNYITANFDPQSRKMLRGLLSEQGAKTLEDGRNVKDIGITISWHNAGVIAIRQLISDVKLIPGSSSFYEPCNNVGYSHTTGNEMMKDTVRGTLNLTGMQFPVCEIVALNSVGRG